MPLFISRRRLAKVHKLPKARGPYAIDSGGFSLFGIAQAWAELMRRLGYERYAAQGTDVGSGVAGVLGMVDPQHVVGIHLSGTAGGIPISLPQVSAYAPTLLNDQARAAVNLRTKSSSSGRLSRIAFGVAT